MPATIRRATDADRDRISEIRFAVKENILRDRSRVTYDMITWFIENPGIWLWEEDGKVLEENAAILDRAGMSVAGPPNLPDRS